MNGMSKMKFKLGDKVRVKGYSADAQECPLYVQRWRGKTCTVTLMFFDDAYLLENEEGEKAWIHEAFLEPADDPAAPALRMAKGIERGRELRPRHIYKGGRKLVVLWQDGTKTIVERAKGEPDSTYAAFTAALAIKVFGSNSRVRKIVETVEESKKKRKRKGKEVNHEE